MAEDYAVFSRTNKVSITPAGTVLKIAGEDFTRRGIRFSPAESLEREGNFLATLEGPHFPKVIKRGEGYLETQFCGVRLGPHNLPADWHAQVEEICGELRRHRIVHRDIKEGNLLVIDSTLVLIDFGWAFKWPWGFFLSPRELSWDTNGPRIYSNRQSLLSLVRRISVS